LADAIPVSISAAAANFSKDRYVQKCNGRQAFRPFHEAISMMQIVEFEWLGAIG